MALEGVVLDNAADMAACFPELWPSREAAKKDAQRKGTNCYYRSLYNSKMSPTSVEVAYRPVGPGHRDRVARVDLARIPDPEAWLANRLGPLARCEIRRVAGAEAVAPGPSDAARLDALAFRAAAGAQAALAARRTTLDALAARLEAAKPAVLRPHRTPNPTEEERACVSTLCASTTPAACMTSNCPPGIVRPNG
jgi:putative DNA primase/helicase